MLLTAKCTLQDLETTALATSPTNLPIDYIYWPFTSNTLRRHLDLLHHPGDADTESTFKKEVVHRFSLEEVVMGPFIFYRFGSARRTLGNIQYSTSEETGTFKCTLFGDASMSGLARLLAMGIKGGIEKQLRHSLCECKRGSSGR